jgi:Rrf2 family protein
MQITRQVDYATRAILYLAGAKKGKRVATSEIATEQQIPPSFLPKIISQLSVGGLLNTSRGAYGGITLAREPEQITLLDVIEAIDGSVQLNICLEGKGVCAFEGNCPLQSVWCDTQKELVMKLKNTNFGQLSAFQLEQQNF